MDGVENESTEMPGNFATAEMNCYKGNVILIVSEVCLPFFSAFIFFVSSLFLAGAVFVAGAEGAAGAGGSAAVGLDTHWMLVSSEGIATSFTVKNSYFTSSSLEKQCLLIPNTHHKMKVYVY